MFRARRVRQIMDEDVTIPNKTGNQNEIALILLHFTSEYNMEPRGK